VDEALRGRKKEEGAGELGDLILSQGETTGKRDLDGSVDQDESSEGIQSKDGFGEKKEVGGGRDNL